MYQSVTKLLVVSLKKNAFLCPCPFKKKVAAADSMGFHFWPVLENNGVFLVGLGWVGQLPTGQHPAVQLSLRIQTPPDRIVFFGFQSHPKRIGMVRGNPFLRTYLDS